MFINDLSFVITIFEVSNFTDGSTLYSSNIALDSDQKSGS